MNSTLKKIRMRAKRIDILINNAGYAQFGTLEQMEMDSFRAQFDTNFFGAVQLMKAVLPGMRERKRGHIINISGTSGVWGQPFLDAYCASKFALEGLVESMAPVYRQFGVHFSLI